MKVEILIGKEKRSLGSDFEQWIDEQVRNRRKANAEVEVIIEIGGDLNLRFRCADGPQRGPVGRARKYSSKQQEVVDLWIQLNLDKEPIDLEGLLSFLDRLKSMS